MITEIIKLLKSDNFYGGGKIIEFAKGKNELTTSWAGMVYKIKRICHSKKI